MANTERRLLKDQDARSVMPFHRWGAVIVGAVVLVPGAFVLAYAVDTSNGTITWGSWTLATLGGGLTVASLAAMLHGVRGLMHKRRLDVWQRQFPREPWRYDHSWRADGVADDTLWRITSAILINAFVASLIVPLNAMVFGSREHSALAPLALLIADAAIAIGVGYVIYMMARWIKFGRSRLRFKRYPFLLGQPMEVGLFNPRIARRCEHLRVTLQCVQEEYVCNAVSKKSDTLCYQLWADKQELDLTARDLSGEIALRFELPNESALETRLRDRPPRYWELIVKGAAPGIDYSATFLIPVYAKGPTKTPLSV